MWNSSTTIYYIIPGWGTADGMTILAMEHIRLWMIYLYLPIQNGNGDFPQLLWME